MIIVKNRELLIPEHERYIGTPIDNYADNRIFKIKRFSQSGEDLLGLAFRLDLKYPTERTVYTFTRSTTHTGGSVSVLSKTFVKAYPNAGTYTFSFNGTEWKRSSNAVDLEEIGVVINFTPVSGDTITVVSTISNVSGNVVLLEKEIGDNEINLIWHITENDTAIPGTVFVAIRGSDGDATVRYASYYAALYVDANLDQTALPAGGITELEQLENMTADQLRKMEYLYNRYKDLDVAAQDAEAWAKGTRNGYPVPAGDDTYQNNAKYYADLREEATHLAEAWARGTKDGADIPSGQPGYHDNAKYWKTVSEGWAHGGTGTHTNEQTDNAKYWSEISHAYANQVSYKKVYANVAEMVADTELIDGQVVRTLGYYAVNDGGAGLYYIMGAVPVDGYYEPLRNGLTALLIANDIVMPEMYGAKGDGETDDTTAINSAVASGKPVFFKAKTYLVGGPINVLSGSVLLGKHTIIHAPAKNAISNVFLIEGCNRVLIDGFKIYSERTEQEGAPQGYTHVSPLGSNVHGIAIVDSSFITIKNCSFENLKADFWLQNNTNNTECADIDIVGWKSRNTTMPMYANNTHSMLIENADILPAYEMGDGDHAIYIGSYCHDWMIKDSVFINPDQYYGPTITGHGASDNENPYDIILENCEIRSLYSPSIYIGGLSKFVLRNCQLYKEYDKSPNVVLGGVGTYTVYDCIIDCQSAKGNIVSGADLEMYGGNCKCGIAFIIIDGKTIKLDGVKFDLFDYAVNANAAVNTATIEFTNCVFIASNGNYFFTINTNGLIVRIINCSFLKIGSNACIIFNNGSNVLTAKNYVVMNVSALTTKNNTAKLFYSEFNDAIVSGVFLGNTLYVNS